MIIDLGEATNNLDAKLGAACKPYEGVRKVHGRSVAFRTRFVAFDR